MVKLNIKIIFLLLLFSKLNSFSQSYGNEWVTEGKQYYKLEVNVSGIYRITKAEMDAKGFTNSGLDPRKLKLTYRGQEMAINVVGESDGVFDANDYVEFYAKNNDGFQDSEVYLTSYFPTVTRMNNLVSIFSDYTSYFLHFDTTNGKRMDAAPAANTGLTSDPNFNYTKTSVFQSEWNWFRGGGGYGPDLNQSYLEKDEGLVGAKIFNHKTPAASSAIPSYGLNNFVLDNMIPSPPNGSVSANFGVAGRIDFTISRTVEANFGFSNTELISLTGYESKIINKQLNNLTSNILPIEFKITSTTSTRTEANPDDPMGGNFPLNEDLVSVMHCSIKYPRTLSYLNEGIIELLQNASLSRLTLTNATQNPIAGYEISDFYNQKQITKIFNSGNNSLDVYVNGAPDTRKIFFANSNKLPYSTSLKVFSTIVPSAYNYLLVSDERLMGTSTTGALGYKNFRESAEGNSYKVLLITTNDIMDRFCYGERNPIGIKRFASYMLNNSKPRMLFLLGRANSKWDFVKDWWRPDFFPSGTNKGTRDWVPTFGYPASDVLLTSGLKGKPLTVPAIPTARLVVNNATAITTYIAKVKEFELSRGEWQKNFLYLAGPKNTGEFVSLPATMNAMKNTAINSTFAASSTNFPLINKPANDLHTQAVPDIFYENINNPGAGVFVYYGHGVLDETDHNFGYVSKQTLTPELMTPTGGPTRYLNKAKYPFIFLNGCGVANSFGATSDIASDWVNTADRGAIMALSQSFLSFESSDDPAMKELFKTWFGTSVASNSTFKNSKVQASLTDQPMGTVVQKSNANFLIDFPSADPTLANSNPFYVANLTQSILLGDPAIAILNTAAQLPLASNFLNFKAINNEDKSVSLKWEVAENTDISSFVVERSSDAKKYEKIGEVAVNKNEITAYEFEDKSPIFGTSYYRIKMLDYKNIDNKYSQTISLNITDRENNLVVKGNPIINSVFEIELKDIDVNSISIINSLGTQLNFEVLSIKNNNAVLRILPSVNNKSYLLSVSNNKGLIFTRKLVN